jgi:methylated-DNA-[protein]-cysteine S-methyltransferase
LGAVHNIISSPIGNLTLVAENDKLTGVYQAGQSNYPKQSALGESDINDVISAAAKQLKEYFAGERAAFDLPLAEADTDFKTEVLTVVRGIPYGEVVTYGDIADRIGKPRTALYVAGALNANKLTIVVPCHRVIGANSLRYVADLSNKQFLQKHEASNREKVAALSAPVKKKGFLARLLG